MNGALPCWSCSSRKEKHKKNPTKDPKHLEIMALLTLSLDWLFSSQGGTLFPETYWSKISDLTQCPMVRPDWRVDDGVCTCEEAGRQLTSRLHVLQLMQFWAPLWKGSMENEHGNAYAAWLFVGLHLLHSALLYQPYCHGHNYCCVCGFCHLQSFYPFDSPVRYCCYTAVTYKFLGYKGKIQFGGSKCYQ